MMMIMNVTSDKKRDFNTTCTFDLTEEDENQQERYYGSKNKAMNIMGNLVQLQSSSASSDLVVTLKKTDDQDKDEEPSAGSNRGSKRQRSDKEESSKEATQKKSKSTSSSKERVEDLQLAVEKLSEEDKPHQNLTHTAEYHVKDSIHCLPREYPKHYLLKMTDRNLLMRTDELTTMYRRNNSTMFCTSLIRILLFVIANGSINRREELSKQYKQEPGYD
ncbi:hypothetical protein Tco_0750175 [Tanacetum coccineum]|uniref:Uncharacterized protein n=1 Tax=Tanacetum coccineum TaxID=301880 RepID=A0ABQ4Z0G7_9ASTR